MILVATGQLVGEGFDYPRLDTLIMATPIAFKGIVEQFAGRLDRSYPGKSSVCVYYYVDMRIKMFSDMYKKRIRAYKKIGYELAASTDGSDGIEKDTVVRSIFDYNNYINNTLNSNNDDNPQNSNELLVWKDGFLLKAIFMVINFII